MSGLLKGTKRSSNAREEQRRHALYLVNSCSDTTRDTVIMTPSEASTYFYAITTGKSGG